MRKCSKASHHCLNDLLDNHLTICNCLIFDLLLQSHKSTWDSHAAAGWGTSTQLESGNTWQYEKNSCSCVHLMALQDSLCILGNDVLYSLSIFQSLLAAGYLSLCMRTALVGLKRILDMQIYELKDPVQDEKGVVYEREAIVGYLRERSGRAPCPVAGAALAYIMARALTPLVIGSQGMIVLGLQGCRMRSQPHL